MAPPLVVAFFPVVGSAMGVLRVRTRDRAQMRAAISGCQVSGSGRRRAVWYW